jgi:RNA polymerase sigma-70 factor, ECF subfamily
MNPEPLSLVRTPPLPTAELIKEIARTDRRRAMTLAVERYRGKLYHHALYIVKDHQEAYDVVQEVFIKAIRERRFFDDDFKMKAWLFRVTSNLCFNIVRNRKRRGAILDTMQQPTSSSPDQVERVLSEERQEVILEAMDRLTRDHKEILMLRYYSDLSYAEIADTQAHGSLRGPGGCERVEDPGRSAPVERRGEHP